MSEKNIFRLFGKTLCEYKLAGPESRIMLALSGGADSYAMSELFYRWSRRIRFSVEICAVHVDLWADQGNVSSISKYCDSRNMKLHIISRPAEEITDRIRQSKNYSPCYICARMRRMLMFKKAVETGFLTIALGHNLTDFAETAVISLFYSGQLEMMPVSKKMNCNNLTVIRPLALITSDSLRRYTDSPEIPVRANICPYHDRTSRMKFRPFITELFRENAYTAANIRSAVDRWEKSHRIESGSVDILTSDV